MPTPSPTAYLLHTLSTLVDAETEPGPDRTVQRGVVGRQQRHLGGVDLRRRVPTVRRGRTGGRLRGAEHAVVAVRRKVAQRQSCVDVGRGARGQRGDRTRATGREQQAGAGRCARRRGGGALGARRRREQQGAELVLLLLARARLTVAPYRRAVYRVARIGCER